MREAPALAIAADRVSTRSRAPAAAKPRSAASRPKSKPPSLLRRAFARPGVTVAGAVFAAVMTGIVTNAILFQKGQHPSPLFGGQAQPADIPTPPRRAAEVAPPVVAPKALTQTEEPAPAPAPAQRAPVATPAPVAQPKRVTTADSHAAAAPHKAQPAAHKPAPRSDLIGKLLSGSSTAPKSPSAKTAAAEEGVRPHAARKSLATPIAATQQ